MRKIALYTLPAIALTLLCVSCGDDERQSAATTDQDIHISASMGNGKGTSRALLESDDILTDGSTVKVYGIAKSADGTTYYDISGHDSEGKDGSTKLNDGQIIKYASATGWSYYDNSGEAYQWKANANHHFFGWLDTDAKSSLNAASFFGSGFTYSYNSTGTDAGKVVLNIPAKEMGISSSNLDFAFSDVVIRNCSQANYSSVELPLKHLFASFGLSARNYTNYPITVSSVKIHNLIDKVGATVKFGEAETTCSYGTSGTVISPTTLNTSAFTLAAAGQTGDSKTNIITLHGDADDAPAYFLVWPQDISLWEDDDTKPYLEITYSINGGTSQTVSVYLPYDDDIDQGWTEGTRHMMELSFSDKEINLTVMAGNWNKQEPVIDYGGVIAVTTPLRIAEGKESNCILSSDGKTAYFHADMPIILEFCIDQPENATWIIDKTGDFDVFEIDNYTDDTPLSELGDGTENAEGIITPGQLARIAITPTIKSLQKEEYSIQLSFSVRKSNSDMATVDESQIYNNTPPTGSGQPPISPRTFVLLKE